MPLVLNLELGQESIQNSDVKVGYWPTIIKVILI